MWILLVPLLMATATQKGVQFTWQAKATAPYKSCAKTGPYCLTGFSLKEIVGGKQNTIATFAQTAKTYTIPMPSIGSHIYILYQNGRNAKNVSVQSSNSPTVKVTCTKTAGKTSCKVG